MAAETSQSTLKMHGDKIEIIESHEDTTMDAPSEDATIDNEPERTKMMDVKHECPKVTSAYLLYTLTARTAPQVRSASFHSHFTDLD